MKSDFVTKENVRRLERYKKDTLLENYMLQINKALLPLENYKKPDKKFPTLFVFGLPRSGTTLTYQLLAYSLDLGYVNNLIARFWMAPLHGIMLSKAVLGNSRDDSFLSDYGKSVNPRGPHEFAYFWQHWLKMTSIENMLKFGVRSESLNWGQLSCIVANMQEFFDKGMVFKTNFVANYIKEFSQTFNMPIFIYIERSLADVALSILRARKMYYGNYETWWATYPPDYEALKSLRFDEQIAGQVTSLRRVYEEQLSRIDSQSVIRINYKQLCQSPRLFVETVSRRIASLYGYEVGLVNAPPASYKESVHNDNHSEAEMSVLGVLERHNGGELL